MQYRRNYLDGGTYFFALNLAERSKRLLVEHIDNLRTAIRLVKQRHPFKIEAMVVLPDHLHALDITSRGFGLCDAVDADQNGVFRNLT